MGTRCQRESVDGDGVTKENNKLDGDLTACCSQPLTRSLARSPPHPPYILSSFFLLILYYLSLLLYLLPFSLPPGPLITSPHYLAHFLLPLLP